MPVDPVIQLSFGHYLISCDEMSPMSVRCQAAVEVEYHRDLSRVIGAARNTGWRVYADERRRDLCPGHRVAARRRLTLVS